MNIIILGSSGFIGSNLLKVLQDIPHNILIYNRERRAVKSINDNSFVALEKFLTTQTEYLVVVNLLAIWGNYSNDEIFKANFDVPNTIRNEVIKYSEKFVWIQISSYFQFYKMIFGIDKDYYSFCKRMFSEHIKQTTTSNIKSSDLYLPHVYGNGDKKNRIIPTLLNVRDDVMLELSSGNQKMPILNVKDCVLAIKNFILEVESIPSYSQFYVQDYEQLTLKQISKIILAKTFSNQKVTFNGRKERKNEFYDSIVSPIPTYGYKPKIDLKKYTEEG
jgi:nucleoside-diphosphate-sugar epimerase